MKNKIVPILIAFLIVIILLIVGVLIIITRNNLKERKLINENLDMIEKIDLNNDDFNDFALEELEYNSEDQDLTDNSDASITKEESDKKIESLETDIESLLNLNPDNDFADFDDIEY